MHPTVKHTIFNICNCTVILLCKCGGKIPGNHHVYIVFVTLNFCNKVKVAFIKAVIKEIGKEQTDAVT